MQLLPCFDNMLGMGLFLFCMWAFCLLHWWSSNKFTLTNNLVFKLCFYISVWNIVSASSRLYASIQPTSERPSSFNNISIGPLHDPVKWYGINYTGTQITQWDFQNRGTRTSPAGFSFVLKVPLHNLRPSVIYPCHVTGSCKGPINTASHCFLSRVHVYHTTKYQKTKRLVINILSILIISSV